MRTRWGNVNQFFPLLILLLVLGLVGFLAYKHLDRFSSEKGSIVVAHQDIAAGTVLNKSHLAMTRIAKKDANPSAILNPTSLLGKTVLANKKRGDPLLLEDIIRDVKADASISSSIPSGRLLTTLTLPNITIPPKLLTPGDILDILVAVSEKDERRGARVAIRDVYIVGYVDNSRPEEPVQKKNLLDLNLTELESRRGRNEVAVLIALKPEDMLTLATIDGTGAHLSLALHGRGGGDAEEKLVITNPVQKVINKVELIVGSQSTEVVVP